MASVSRGPMFFWLRDSGCSIDLSVWYIGRWLQPLYRQGVISLVVCILQSIFMVQWLCVDRTFANCQETALLAVSIALMGRNIGETSTVVTALLRGRAALSWWYGVACVSLL
jgi:hypothetical protein